MRLPLRTSFQRKLVSSFCIAISVVTVLIGGISNVLFSRNYRNAIERQNNIFLEQLVSQMDHEIFSQITSLSIDILTDSTVYPECTMLFNTPYANRSVNIKACYDNIRSAISRYENVIQSIDIYYANSGLVVSSYSGMHLIESREGDSHLRLWEPVADSWQGVSRWEYGRLNPRLGETVSYLTAYPRNSADPKGFLAVQLSPGAFSGLFADYGTEDTRFYVFGPGGEMVFGDAEAFGSALDEEDVRGALSLSGKTPAILPTDRSGGVVLSGVSSAYSGFVILSVTSTQLFYRGANEIQLLLLAVAAGVFLLGLLLSGVFTARLYRPMKRILMAGQPWNNQVAAPGERSFDEYSYLTDTLRQLSEKATEYEAIRKDNLQIMRYGFLQSLLYNKQLSREAILQNAAFLDLQLKGPYFRVLHLQVVHAETASPQEQELVLYQLISTMESLSGRNGIHFFGVKNGDDTVTMLCSCETEEREALLQTLEAYNLYCGTRFRTRHTLCASDTCTALTDIHLGCDQVNRIRPYLFFMPDRQCLEKGDIPALEHPVDEMEFSVEDAIQGALAQKDAEAFRRAIQDFTALCKSGRYTWEASNRRLISVLMIVARAIREEGDAAGRPVPLDITGQFAMCSNIDEFEVWILQTAYHCLAPLHSTALSPLIEKVTAYVRERLREPISLESIAFYLGLTPNYLGKLFREEMGVSFVEYVNGRRLELALEMLTETASTVEEIAAESGFNSSTYFIRKFKQKYRMTPKAYRLHRKIAEPGPVGS